jgi:formate-dependent nitrite reductase cytochrome c552 subunit
MIGDTTMKTRLTIVLAVGFLGVGLTYWQVGLVAPAVAGEEAAVAATATLVPALNGETEHEYVGNKKCKKCHMKEYKSWADTKKAKTFDLLKPGQASEAKQKANLDPNKDYTKDESCLKCHATGFGKTGGYAIPDTSDEKAVKESAALEGVGCESCHGPGSNFINVHEEIKKSKRTYSDEEMYAAGLHKIEEASCTRCHNEESPTYVPFDYEKQKTAKEGTHEMFPLKQRQE